ncbi:MAG: ribonuclease HI family protein [Chloroflexi bacterium]|nr:ribonuclease HI family protein [Chloroflexota bacterium]
MERLIIYTDGASHGNPGPASIGVAIKDGLGRTVFSLSQPIGRTTNNQAEYRAVIAALEMALKMGATNVELRSDSELIVRQVNNQYRVKEPSLKPRYDRVKQLQRQFHSFNIVYIPREQNEEANRLAAMALK